MDAEDVMRILEGLHQKYFVWFWKKGSRLL